MLQVDNKLPGTSVVKVLIGLHVFVILASPFIRDSNFIDSQFDSRMAISAVISISLVILILLLGDDQWNRKSSSERGLTQLWVGVSSIVWGLFWFYLWINFETVNAAAPSVPSMITGIITFIVAALPTAIGINLVIKSTISEEDATHKLNENKMASYTQDIETAINNRANSGSFSDVNKKLRADYKKFVRGHLLSVIEENWLDNDRGLKYQNLYPKSIKSHFEDLDRKHNFMNLKLEDYKEFIQDHHGAGAFARSMIGVLFDMLMSRFKDGNAVNPRIIYSLIVYIERYHSKDFGNVKSNPNIMDEFGSSENELINFLFDTSKSGSRHEPQMNAGSMGDIAVMLIIIYEDAIEQTVDYVDFLSPDLIIGELRKVFQKHTIEKISIPKFWTDSFTSIILKEKRYQKYRQYYYKNRKKEGEMYKRLHPNSSEQTDRGRLEGQEITSDSK